ncbi:Lnb N-terminal periplasmic domain-containing protein [Stenotrophomonas sepilia]|uniref:Lnb N-terminal periplasmic domain-containing protein n=1 Tax=Stenotrophomonas sepilia TaxID=2860290 RepID=UPI0024BEBABD|nr:DUF4105 domain-containing protein [Stenotrophomonas sepilia]MDJ1624235.1 DUF4105 domain-containing protein [Stenotrophomonas sepilia]
MALAALWVTGLLAYQMPGPGWLANGIAVLWLLAALWASWRVARGRSSRRLGLAFGASLALAGLWWLLLTPRQDRVWADDVAQRLHVVSFDGRHVVFDSVRDFTWRSETDYDAHWVRRAYDLDQLRSADLVLSYWMGPAIAHTLISFGFEDGRQVVFSLEIRKERGESFSALGGFFRRFEMTLVAAEETDIIRTRTNARGEDVYLYRLHGMDRAQLKELFAAYIAQARELDAKPGFYNTLTSNCTTIVFDLARHIAPRLPLDYRLLLSGYLAEYAQEVGALTPGVPYAELHDKGRITQRALDLGSGEHFSTVIRQGVPGTEQDPQ